MKWASLKYLNFDSSKSLPVPNRDGISAWVAEVFSAISVDCIRSIFEHIDYSNNNVSPPPNTLFLNIDNSDSERIGGNDLIQINDL